MEHSLNHHNPFSFKKQSVFLPGAGIKRLLVKQFRWPSFPRGFSSPVKPGLCRGCAGPGCRGNSCCHCNRLETWEGQSRSLKSMQGCEAPTSQELLIPNPLDLILLWAVIEFALLAWERGSVLPVQAQASARGSPGPLEDVTASSPRSHPCQVWGAMGSCWLQGLQHLPGSGLIPASLSRAGMMWSRGVSPGGSLGASSTIFVVHLTEETAGWQSIKREHL